jgi:hypothetical protein
LGAALGRATLEPATATVGERVALRLGYVAPPAGIAPGGSVKFVVFGRSRWSLFQTVDPDADEIALIDDPYMFDEEGRPWYGTGVQPCSHVAASVGEPAVKNTMMRTSTTGRARSSRSSRSSGQRPTTS